MKRKPSRWIYAIVVNLAIAVVATLVPRAIGAGDHADETRRDDYEERAEAVEEPLPVAAGQEARFHRETEPTRRP